MKTSKNASILTLLRQLWAHLAKRRKRQFLIILFITILNTFVEVLSLGALIPFLGVLVSPEQVFEQAGVREVAATFGFDTPDSIIRPLTIIFIGTVILAGVFRVLHLRAVVKVTFGCGADLSEKLYDAVLRQSYSQHLKQSSAAIISGLSKVDVAVNALSQVVRFISSVFLIISIIGALLYVNPTIAVMSFAFFGMAYILINAAVKARIKGNSFVIAKNKTRIIKLVQDALGGIRDIILDRTQWIFLGLYTEADKELRNAEGSNSIIEGSPRFLMEAIGMVFVAMLAYILSVRHGGIQSSLPLLGMMALSAQRMLPAFQQAYNGWTAVKGHQSSLAEVLHLLELPAEVNGVKNTERMPFKIQIQLVNVSYLYSQSTLLAVKNVSLQINRGERVGIIGASGCGKSTLIDIIMGLLEPASGEIIVDGREVTLASIGGWRQNITHVPQGIFLTDRSIRENIAFGVNKNDIDEHRVRQAAQLACIADVVEGMPNGYDTLIGERGVNLSGGERQRLGIARALYRDSEILILDEATSALDTQTEAKLMNLIEEMPIKRTLIMIAHRLSTIMNCDKIYVMKNGEIVDEGKYQEILTRGIYLATPEDI